MAKKRKDMIERKEMMKLTKVAKAWEFTCTFCFKKFPSAQAMGGHQNAHRGERLQEKKLFIKDPIAYRKRAFLRASAHKSDSAEGGSSSGGAVHAADFDGNDGGNHSKGGDDGKGKACIEYNIVGYLDHKLDLTLKL